MAEPTGIESTETGVRKRSTFFPIVVAVSTSLVDVAAIDVCGGGSCQARSIESRARDTEMRDVGRVFDSILVRDAALVAVA